jgi:hypothetical protein
MCQIALPSKAFTQLRHWQIRQWVRSFGYMYGPVLWRRAPRKREVRVFPTVLGFLTGHRAPTELRTTPSQYILALLANTHSFNG